MSESDKSGRTKARILTIVVASGLFVAYAFMFYDAGYQLGQNSRKANVESEKHAHDAAQQTERSCGKLPFAFARECIAEVIEAQRDTERAERDLVAQLEAANWAKWAGIAALIQVIATVVGLYFLQGTLEETRKAVEGAGNANKIANESLNRGRPYVMLATVEAEQQCIRSEDGTEQWGYRIIPTWKNHGQMLAVKVCNSTSWKFKTSSDDVPIFDRRDDRKTGTGYVPPGHSQAFAINNIVGDEVKPWVAGQVQLIIHMIIWYQSPREQERYETEMCIAAVFDGYTIENERRCPILAWYSVGTQQNMT